MAGELLLLVIVLRILTFILGGIIVTLAYRGYRRSKSLAMVYLTVGLLFVTVGSFIEGALFEFAGQTNVAHAVESSLLVIGFVTIIYAIRRA